MSRPLPLPLPLPDVNHTYPLRVKDDERGLFTTQRRNDDGSGYDTVATTLDSEQSGLFAAKDIAAGDLIIRLGRPLLAVLDSPHFTDTCSNCFVYVSENEDEEEVVKLNKCGGCGVVRFCGKTCQSQSWLHSHKYECKIFKRLYPRILPNVSRLIMQLLLRRKAQTLSIDDWIAVTTLIEHYNELRSDSQRAEIFQNLKLIAKATVEYSNSSEELDFVERLLSRVLVNTLTLTTSTYTPLGLVLDPVVSMINHSCAPNAVISFSGSTLSLYSLISIRKDAQITISYVDNSVQPSMRQARLKSSYFFTCTCDECRVDTTLGRPDVPPELRPAAESGALRKADEHAAQKDAIACQYMNDDPGKGLKELQEGLRIIESMVPQTPYHRQPYAKLRVDYILACLATKDYLSAFVHSLVAYFYIDPIHFPQPFHPLRVVHNWTLFRLVLQVANLWQEGDVGLKGLVDRHQLNFGTILAGLSMEVEGNVARGHGPESKFGVLVRRKMAQLRTDLRGMGSGQGPQAQDVEEEWKKLRNIANGAQV